MTPLINKYIIYMILNSNAWFVGKCRQSNVSLLECRFKKKPVVSSTYLFI
jgi:hypothetical protein